MELIDFIDDALFYSSRLVKTKKFESGSRTIFILIYLLTVLIYLYYLSYSYRTQSNISFSQLFIQEEDYEQSMTFGFVIDNNLTDKIIIELFDSDNNPIFNYDTCDENLNLLADNEVNLTQKRNFKCFINYKFKKSYTTNHQIKIHLKKNNSCNFDEIKQERIPLIIKFKEPIVGHSLDNPFIFPNELQELIYFYDKDNITSYRKYAKIIEYKTYGLFSLFSEEETINSHYFEDYEDSSKTIDDYNNEEMIGSFRICLSKKKDIFERRYKNVFELFSTFGGVISLLNIFFNILITTFVKSLDHLRLLNSIRKKIIPNNNDNTINQGNIIKDFWNEPNDNNNLYEDVLNDNNNLDLSRIPEFTDKDKEKFILISICRKIDWKIILIFFTILIIAIIIIVSSYFCTTIILWSVLGIIFFVVGGFIIKYLCNKEGCCSCCSLFHFIYHIAIIIFFAFIWSLFNCSFAFFYDNKWLLWLLVVIEVIIIAFSFLYYWCKYQCYKDDDNFNLNSNQNSKKIYPFAIEEDVNSKIDTLIENEIKKSKIIY